jgi:phage-related protein
MLFLKLIRGGTWRLYAICTTRGDCPLEEFLGSRAELGKDKDRMLRRLEAIAEHGPEYLPDISHQIEPEIWQTEQGRIRVLWFYDRGRMIVVSHGFVKRTQKTPAREKQTALRMLAEYKAARAANAVVILEDQS